MQAASAIQNFNMESPVKKLNFDATDKENKPFDEATITAMADNTDIKKSLIETKKEEKPAIAAGIKAEEADEPLLQENPQRFVLFPIKYHEVRDASETRKVVSLGNTRTNIFLDLANVQEGRGFFLDCRRD